MNIITIDREFGSGGREVGKRLADELHIPCYDRELIEEVAKQQGLDVDHVAHISERDMRTFYPRTIGRRFTVSANPNMSNVQVAVSVQEVIRRFARQGSCVIVGQCADVTLREYKPLNIFVYANTDAKVTRCQNRTSEGEVLQPREIARKIRQVEKDRAAYRELFAETKWGRKETYHLCINTSGIEIKTIIPALADYARLWFQNNHL